MPIENGSFSHGYHVSVIILLEGELVVLVAHHRVGTAKLAIDILEGILVYPVSRVWS